MKRPFWIGRSIAASIAVLPLVCWPGVEHAFSAPKLWLIGGIDVLIAAQYLTRAAQRPAMSLWPCVAWIAAVSLSAITGPYVSLQAFLLLVLPLALCVAGVDAIPAVCRGAAVESAIVLLQFFNRDPFQWLGWRPEPFASPRMRVYGTLGNPDFVAAWLCATLPLCVAVKSRTLRVALVVLHLSAILCTGSRVVLIALPAAMLAAALCAGPLRKSWLLIVPVMAAAIWFSTGRSLGAVVQGRIYYAKVIAAHAKEVPVAGYGPGSFEPEFARWQATWLREHPQDARFSGPVDHAHDDYLEFWIEYAPLGLGMFLVLCGWLLLRARRSRAGAAPAAALAALLAVAVADFPLHRPAEWALFCIVAGSLPVTRRME